MTTASFSELLAIMPAGYTWLLRCGLDGEPGKFFAHVHTEELNMRVVITSDGIADAPIQGIGVSYIAYADTPEDALAGAMLKQAGYGEPP